VEASFQHPIERNVVMHEHDFWTNCADAMEMSIEGERLIVREIADLVRGFWTRAVLLFDRGSLDELLRGHWRHRHLPPL
jgi:hypothetical protein